MSIRSKTVTSIRKYLARSRIRNREFTIVSNNCWGAHIYQSLGKPYTTPFVGLFVPPESYIKLVPNLRWYLAQPIRFIDSSAYDRVNEFRAENASNYPIGRLGEDVEIHFLHYSSEQEASQKWNRRVNRITQDDRRLFFKFCDHDRCSHEQLASFDALPIENKVCFVSKPCPDLKSAVHIPNCKDGRVPDGLKLSRISPVYFDAAGWICCSNTEPYSRIHQFL